MGLERVLKRGRALCRRFCRHSDAASLGEYALLLGVITVALVLVLSQFKDAINNGFGRASSTLSSAEVGANGTGGNNTGGSNAGGNNAGGNNAGGNNAGGNNAGGNNAGGNNGQGQGPGSNNGRKP